MLLLHSNLLTNEISFVGKIVYKWALWVLYCDLLHFDKLIMLYHTCMDLPNLFSEKGSFFFFSLMAGPTYQPSVWHSNPNFPLISHYTRQKLFHTLIILSDRVWLGKVRPTYLTWPLTLCRLGQATKNLAWPWPFYGWVGSGQPLGQPGLSLPADSLHIYRLYI